MGAKPRSNYRTTNTPPLGGVFVVRYNEDKICKVSVATSAATAAASSTATTVAAASSAAATTVAAASSTTAAAVAASSAAATAPPVVCFRACLVNIHSPTFQVFAVHLLYRRLALFIGRHFNESKTSGLAGKPVLYDIDGLHLTKGLERHTYFIFRHIVR
jgi:hypothetical protein